MPVTHLESSSRAGDSRAITRDYFDSLLIEMRHLDSVVPNTECEIFGHKFSTPIMTAALSHLGKTRETSLVGMAMGAAAVNALMWCGMGDEAELEDIVSTGARTVKIIKPYADRDEVYRKIAHAKKCGAVACGMDVDHEFGRNGLPDVVLGNKMAPVTSAELAEFVKASELPFVIKGVNSLTDAVKCAEAGVSAIVVSHHNTVMEYAVPPLVILPEIVREVGGKLTVFVDCGITNGMDAYKALCLGADAVSIGAALMPVLAEKGPDGVADALRAMTDELRGVMAHTNTPDLAHFDPTVLHRI